MIETFAALLLGHAVGDFLAQPGWMARGKARAHILLAHVGIVAAATWVALGLPMHPAVAIVVLSHLLIDMLKVHALNDRLSGFAADQALHVAVLAGVAAWAPGLYGHGLWAALPGHPGLAAALSALPAAQLYAAGAILATLAGGYAVGKLLTPFLEAAPELTEGSLRDAGRLIGLLERGVAFILVVAGQPAGVGFLIAAKSVLRFTTARDDRKISEYVIIGTLASMGWAVAVAFATTALAARLP